MRAFAIFVSVILLAGGSTALFFPEASGIEEQSDFTEIGPDQTIRMDSHIHLKYAVFDPLAGEPFIPEELMGDPMDVALVQYRAPIIPEWRDALSGHARILTFMQDHTFVVFPAPHTTLSDLRSLPGVRWVGAYHPAYRIHADLMDEQVSGAELSIPREITVKLFHGASNPNAVALLLEEIGINVIDVSEMTSIITAQANPSLIPLIAHLPWVEYIEPVGEMVATMDLIREYTGADDLLEIPFNGSGVVGEVKDNGIDLEHVEFVDQLIGTDGSMSEESHGTATFGIVFAKGVNDRALGMAPGAGGIFCNWSVQRYQSIMNLVNNWDGVFQSNSWYQGEPDSSYSVMSWEDDQTILDYDITMLYATGNGGAEQACSQDAVAKNVIAVGGIRHKNNVNWEDDDHTGGQGNRGPADDMRFKPDLCGPYESIYTTRPNSGYTSSFGGTSGATPVNAGGIALIYDMYEGNHFSNNPLLNRPHASTVKALAIANAHQYDLAKAERSAQGWGHIDVGTMYELGKRQFIVDEQDPLFFGQETSYTILADPDQPLKISLVWTDVPGSTATTRNLINNLDLTVTSPSGTTYRGNFGLNESMWSPANGTSDTLNNVENVFIESPEAGEWSITVSGTEIVMDGDRSTLLIDQPYSLVASGVVRDKVDLLFLEEAIPEYFEPNIEAGFSTVVANFGEEDATNVDVDLMIDGQIVSTARIPTVGSDGAETVNFTWTPGAPGAYQLQFLVRPITGEQEYGNNWHNDTIRSYHPMGRIVIDLNHSVTLPVALITELLEADHQVYYTDVWLGNETFDLATYTIGPFQKNGNITGLMTFEPITPFTGSELDAIRAFIDRGGGLLAVGGEDDTIMNDLTSFAGVEWLTDDGLLGPTNNVEDHPITQGVNSLTFDTSELTVTATDPAAEVVNDETFIFQNLLVAVAEVGKGTVVGVSDMSVFSDENLYSDDNLLFALNTADWTNDQIPIVSISLPVDGSIHEPGAPISFVASVNDPDTPDHTLDWSSDLIGPLGSGQGPEMNLTRGIHTITLLASDDMNNASTSITLIVNSTPELSLLGPMDDAYLEGTVTLRWSGYDEEDDPITYAVVVDPLDSPGGPTRYEPDDTRLTLTNLTLGDGYAWYVIGEDPYGRMEMSEIRTFRYSNNEPEVHLVGPEIDSRLPSEPVRISWSGGDEDQDPVTYRLYMRTDVTDLVYEGKATSYDIPGTEEGESYEWWVVADDGFDETTSERRWFEMNTLPTVEFFEPSLNERMGNGPLMVTVLTSDENEDEVGIELYLDDMDVPTTSGTDSLSYELFGLGPGAHNLTVVLNDGFDTTVFGPWQFHVNHGPEIELLGPVNGMEVNNSVSLAWNATDPEDDILVYELFLGKEGDVTLHSRPSSNETTVFLFPGTYLWYVVVSDEFISTRTPPRRFTVPPGTPPEVTIDSVGPDPSITTERITFKADAEDPDGEIATIQWYSDLDGELSQDLNFDITGLSPGLHTLTLSVMDTEGNIGTSTMNIQVLEGSLKTPRAVFLPPPAPYSIGQYITFSFLGSSDQDGNIVEYFIDFGDGSESGWLSTREITHRYTEIGNYILTARVRDDDGLESRNLVKVSISIGSEPVASDEGGEDDLETILTSPEIMVGGIILLLVLIVLMTRKRRA